jgi:Reverse transcriptase (RNA-dependent DNA polymerase)
VTVLGPRFMRWADTTKQKNGEQFDGKAIKLFRPKEKVKMKLMYLERDISTMITESCSHDLVIGMDCFEKIAFSVDFNIREIKIKMGEFESVYGKETTKNVYRLHEEFFKDEKPQLPKHTVYDCKLKGKGSLDKFKTGAARKISDTEDIELKRYLKENKELGFIEASSSLIASPILFVKKKDKSLRLCVDFRQLNGHLEKDMYPLPRIDALLEGMKRKKVFSKIDLRDAYYQIHMDENSKLLTPFFCKYGCFCYNIMPFGLSVAPAFFQRFINGILFEFLGENVICYLDDILIATNSLEENELLVERVITCLKKNNLRSRVSKCEFFASQTEFLGFTLTGERIKAREATLSAISAWTRPESLKELQSFLGLTNYLRNFIREYSELVKPMLMIVDNTRKRIKWETAAENAYEKLK